MSHKHMPIGEEALKLICCKTQITLVRNVADYPFPTQEMRANAVPIDKWLKQIAKIHPFEDLTENPNYKAFASLRFGLAPESDRTAPYRLLRFDTEESPTGYIWLELMAGNHFTFSITTQSLDFPLYVENLERFSDRFAKVFNFAYDEEFGYLTQQLSLTGTGLRIRSWLHLPGLTSLDYLSPLVHAAEVKGVLSEFTPIEEPPPGDIFILYNRFTLNLPLRKIVEDYKGFLLRVAKQEMLARMRMAYDRPEQLFDELTRTLILCRHSILIPEREALNLLSSYFMGCSCDALKPVDLGQFSFNSCFDLVMDALCTHFLLPTLKRQDIDRAPICCQKRYRSNNDMIRALWFRIISRAKFTETFLSRVNQL